MNKNSLSTHPSGVRPPPVDVGPAPLLWGDASRFSTAFSPRLCLSELTSLPLPLSPPLLLTTCEVAGEDQSAASKTSTAANGTGVRRAKGVSNEASRRAASAVAEGDCWSTTDGLLYDVEEAEVLLADFTPLEPPPLLAEPSKLLDRRCNWKLSEKATNTATMPTTTAVTSGHPWIRESHPCTGALGLTFLDERAIVILNA